MAFGQTGILDNFNRANEGPPMTGWTTPAGVGGLIVSGSVCAASTANAFGIYSASPSNANCEAWFTVSTATGAGATVSIFARAKDVSSAATFDAYGLVVTEAATDWWAIRRVDNGLATTLGASFAQEVSNGDGIGIRCSGSTITAWYRSGSAGSWTELASRTDSTYSAAGYLAVSISDTTGRVDNFGGGNFYEETGAAIAGGVASGAETYTPGGTTYNETGTGVAGGVASGAEAAAIAETGAGIANAVASGADVVASADTGAVVANTVVSGADSAAWADGGAGVANAVASGADVAAWADAGAGVAGGVSSGADVAALSDGGYGIADAIASGAETFSGGGTAYNETGAGVAGAEASGADVMTLAESGYSIAGLIATGNDAITYSDTGAAIIGAIAAGGDVFVGVETGAGIAGGVASGVDVAALFDSGYAVAGMIASGADSMATAGQAGRIDYVRELGRLVAQEQPDTRAQGQLTAQAHAATRGKARKVA